MIFSASIDDWTSATVERLVEQRWTESMTVEFKRELSHAQDKHRLELAKDISAMANGSGGWIVYGVDEQPGTNGWKVAGGLCPLESPKEAAQWIDDVIHGNVTPRPRFRVRQIAAADGFFVVVRVDASADDLHMVKGGRFYRRSELGARPMTEPEVRQAYVLITHRRSRTEAHVQESVNSELFGEPAYGFLVALVPHTMREVFDPSRVSGNDDCFGALHREYRNRLRPAEHGLECQLGSRRRFRVRRDGTVGMFVDAHDERGWAPVNVLEQALSVVAVARRLWPTIGIVEPATFALRVRLPRALMAHSDDGWASELTLDSDHSFDLAVHGSELSDSPLAVVQKMMDRLWEIMGERSCPYINNGEVRADVRPHVAHVLQALEASVQFK